MKKNNKVKFIDNSNYVAEEFYPTLSKNDLPEWYVSMHPYTYGQPGARINEKDFSTKTGQSGKSYGLKGLSTIKRCPPVFDAIASGYLLRLPTDLIIENSPSSPPIKEYHWPDWDLIDFHPPIQVEGYPYSLGNKNNNIPKLVNPWSVITSKGYSCLILPPMHRDNVIQVFPGIVDTDTYHSPVELPFLLKDENWTGMIEAGTPVAQIIPFKREKFFHEKMTAEKYGSVPKAKHYSNVASTYNNGYRNRFWQKKDYE